VGNELIGVQTFDTIRVTGGASVEFRDRVIVNDWANTVVDANSQLKVGLWVPAGLRCP
jgi:hypothetical protein